MNTVDDIFNFVWENKYAPQSFSDCILPEKFKNKIEKIIESGASQNIILAGPAGIGKTMTAVFLVKALNADCLFLNASLKGNIDTLRSEIMTFATNKSFNGKRKYVILDEADNLNKNSTQLALRSFMQENIKNCGFIFTCNYLNGIIEPLQSRTAIVDFGSFSADDKAEMAMQFYKRCCFILDNENITYKTKDVKIIVQRYFPDFRRVINELQHGSVDGTLDISGTIVNLDEILDELVILLKKKDFVNIRNFVSQHMDIPGIFDFLYKGLQDKITKNSIPDLILILAKYQYQAAFVASQEINTAACVTELMTLDYV